MQRNMRAQGQRGSALLVAMILLLVFGVMAAATFRGSLTSAQAIGNMQWRGEAVTAWIAPCVYPAIFTWA